MAWNLAKGLRARGHEVEYWVNHKSSDADFVHEMVRPAVRAGRSLLGRVVHRLGINSLQLESASPRHSVPGNPAEFDLIHLHDVGEFNLSHFDWLARQAPLIWTMHCMAPFTGNCLYSYGCDRYMNGCGSCPEYGQWPLHWLHRDGSALNLRLKRWFLRNTPLQLIGVSDWIRERCQESRLFRDQPATTILNAVDPERFFPVHQTEARDRLGVPQDARVVLLSVAGEPQDTRKGLDIAVKALHELHDFPVFLLPLGIAGDSSELREALAGFPGLPPRHVHEDATLRDYYAAADVVWHPSRADTSSMVSLEAFACGTPVIAAAVGGVPEVVKDGKGLLIEANDSSELASATRRFFLDPVIKMGIDESLQRHSAELEFARMLDEHESFYSSFLDAGTPNPIS